LGLGVSTGRYPIPKRSFDYVSTSRSATARDSLLCRLYVDMEGFVSNFNLIGASYERVAKQPDQAKRWLSHRSRSVVTSHSGLGDWYMSDVVFVAIGLGFFATACLYLFACDRL
jgi:hypothetical protein